MENEKLEPLLVWQRAERLARKIGKKLDVQYMMRVHKRSQARVYQALNGKAPGLLRRIDRHLTMLEEKLQNTKEL